MFLQAVGPAVVHGVAFPLFAVIGYLAGLIVLIVGGIWGFRIGSGGDGGNGGGSKRPGVSPAPPSGGREPTGRDPADRNLADGEPGGRDLAGDFAAWEKQFGTPESDPAPTERVSGP